MRLKVYLPIGDPWEFVLQAIADVPGDHVGSTHRYENPVGGEQQQSDGNQLELMLAVLKAAPRCI